MNEDIIQELCKKIDESGVKVAFGLKNQGHYEKVTQMREEGKTWEEIGKVIGWEGVAA